MKKGVLREQLARLYLRLNGYFLSGFIVHAPNGNRTEIDALAVRFPYHSETERVIQPSEYLQTSSTHIDILLCEVKGDEIEFNDKLRGNSDVIRSVLSWIGLFREEEMNQLVHQVQLKMCANEPGKFSEIAHRDNIRIRLIVFAMDKELPDDNQTRYIHGQEVVEYLSKCLRHEQERPMSAPRYDFRLWGEYEPLVRYFKDHGPDEHTMAKLYASFNC